MLFKNRTLYSIIMAPLLVGLIGLLNLMQRPRFASIHTVDVLQLIVSGMCFGVALSGVFALIRGRSRSA